MQLITTKNFQTTTFQEIPVAQRLAAEKQNNIIWDFNQGLKNQALWVIYYSLSKMDICFGTLGTKLYKFL